jgi:hypothetical protein
MAKLSPQQELFAQAVFQGVGLGKAYKQAGYKVSNRNSQDASASKLLRNAKIVERMEEFSQATAISEKVTATTVTNMLAQVYEGAYRDKQHGAAATAALGIAKLHGLLVDRTEDVTRKPARSPDAPIEIEVEHWLTEHKLLGQPNGTGNGAADSQPDQAREPRDAGQLDLFSEGASLAPSPTPPASPTAADKAPMPHAPSDDDA